MKTSDFFGTLAKQTHMLGFRRTTVIFFMGLLLIVCPTNQEFVGEICFFPQRDQAAKWQLQVQAKEGKDIAVVNVN